MFTVLKNGQLYALNNIFNFMKETSLSRYRTTFDL